MGVLFNGSFWLIRVLGGLIVFINGPIVFNQSLFMSKLLQSDSSSDSSEAESFVDLDDLLTDLDTDTTPYVPTTEKTRVTPIVQQDEDVVLSTELEEFLESLEKRDLVIYISYNNN